jgi:hypothetical protein
MQTREPYVADLRAEFFKAYPDSPYGEKVRTGEVVAGMDMYEVLASWGNPARRTREHSQEQWVYFDVDEQSGDAIEYSLSFREGILENWRTRVHRQSGLAYRADREKIDESVTPAEPPTGKRVPKN